jgi:flagellar hook-associated protein 2
MSTTTSATSNAISALGAGSGMDVKALANSLVDAERAPRKDIIDKKISKSEAGISGYSAIKFVLEGLKTSLMDIKDQSDFSSITPRNSQSAAFTVTASATASAGSHSVNVQSLAKAERKLTAGFAATTTTLNNGEAFNLNLSIHGGANQSISVATGKDTPSGIVAAINEANLGIKAQLVNTGEAGAPYKIMVTGQTGALNDFVLSAEAVAPATTLSALFQALL